MHAELSWYALAHRHRQPALRVRLYPHLPLRQVQQRHHGRLLPPRRKAGDDGLHLVGVFRSPAEIASACADFRLIGNMASLAHRSHSPNTTTIAPHMTVASASMWPLVIMSIALRWLNAVGLRLQR